MLSSDSKVFGAKGSTLIGVKTHWNVPCFFDVKNYDFNFFCVKKSAIS